MKNYNMNLFILLISPWPIFMSMSLFLMCSNIIIYFTSMKYIFIFFNFFLVLMSMFFWWNDVIMESKNEGFHNNYIIKFTMNSMIMFIVSEVFFFISFFWTFFYFMFSPDVMIGSMWPSMGIISINFLSLPLMNSVLLLSSGSLITLSHYMMMLNKNIKSKISMMLSMMLGLTFMACQMLEYKMLNFCFSDSVFGSIFFMSTGFHGIHVLIGVTFLFFSFIRIEMMHFSKIHFLGFEFSIWYWHFVDVVWLYLYMVVYWLGS